MNKMKRVNLKRTPHSQPRIVIQKFGKVDVSKINRIVGIMQECYSRLIPHEVDIVDLYVFKRSSAVKAFLNEESRKVGVASSSFDELFFSMHDAWRGISRIIICLERMKKLSALAQKGGIRHEVGHSVLHGSPRYYILTIPPALQDLTTRFKLSRRYVTNMLYLISIAVKDYEVSRLLHKQGYIKDQIAFVKHILALTESDKISWEISRAKVEAEALCLVSYLKPIGCATPFLAHESSREEIEFCIKQSLSFLPKKHSTKLLEQAPRIFWQLKSDTLNNISKFTRLIIEKIIAPHFTR